MSFESRENLSRLSNEEIELFQSHLNAIETIMTRYRTEREDLWTLYNLLGKTRDVAFDIMFK